MNTLTRPSATPRSTPATRDAITLLKADHEALKNLFAEYEMTRLVSYKRALVAEICSALRLHAQIDEEIFYPGVKAVLGEQLLVTEATIAQTGVKSLLAQVEGVEPGGEAFDAKLRLLAEYVKHHARVEQNTMFPKLRAASIDLVELGERMAVRKAALLAGVGSANPHRAGASG